MRISPIIPMALAALTIGLSQLRGAGFVERITAMLGYFAVGLGSSFFAYLFFRGAFDPPPSYVESGATEDINVWGMVQITNVRFLIPFMTAFFLTTALYESARLLAGPFGMRSVRNPNRYDQ